MKPAPLRLLLAGFALGLAALSSPAATSPADIAAMRDKAEQGNAIAQYNLGLVYADVREPAHDYAEAYVWLNLAAQAGATSRALATIVELMTPEERAEGERRLTARRGAAAADAPAPVITALPLDERADTVIGQVAALEADKRQLSDELARAWKENEALRAQTGGQAETRQRLAIAETALASKDREIANLREQIAAAAEADTVATELAETRDQFIALRQMHAALETERDALRHQNDDLRARLATHAADLAATRAQVESTNRDAEALTARETELTDARAQLSLIRGENTRQ